MIQYKRYQQNQDLLLPPKLEELIGKKELVRVVNEVLDKVDKNILDEPCKVEGCPAYNPRMMLKVIIYAYCNKVYQNMPENPSLLRLGMNGNHP